MSSSRNNKTSKKQKTSYICVGSYVADIVGAYFQNISDGFLFEKIRSQLDQGLCFVRNISCLRLDEEKVRFVECGRRSRKISDPSNLSGFLKTQASKICDSGDPFDQLLVNAMWAKAVAESQMYRDETHDIVWQYHSFQSRKIEGGFSLVFSYRRPDDCARNTWVDVNCPRNLLSLYSSGGVPIKGGTVERELPCVAERLELTDERVMGL